MDNHHRPSLATGKRLGIAIVLNTTIFVVECIGGILTNSLALISDALHNLSDVLALILSYAATKIMLWESNSRKSYGYVRVEIFVAFINALTLVGIGLYILYEAVQRLYVPEPVVGEWMIAVAVTGFIGNAWSTWILHRSAHEDLNIRSAYLHLLTDAIESLVVVVVGVLLYWWQWYVLDPVLSIGIGMFVIKGAWDILAETVNILTEGTPKCINLDDVAKFIRSFPEVENVHHLHIWSLSSQFRALSAHVVVADRTISEGILITEKIEKGLLDRFRINHPTLQLEVSVCAEQGTVVGPNHVCRGD